MAQDAGERDREGRMEAGAVREPRVTVLEGSDGTAEDHARAAPHDAQDGHARTAPPLGRNPETEASGLPPHEPGAMDIAQHEATYQAFIRITIRAVIAIFVVLILLALLNG